MATKKKASFIIRGMQRDLSVSKFNPDYAYENMNIRITARESSNLLSITNEKGNKELVILDSNGVPLQIKGDFCGSNILNNLVTIFTAGDGLSRIYRLEYLLDINKYIGTLLFEGDLGFDPEFPIETLGVYENEKIQKVYWVDGKNQPRVINIAPVFDHTKFTSNSFDFAQRVSLDDKITIEKSRASSGMFAPGTIQYAFSYFNQYGQETNIFYTSPLNYIAYNNRGASPEDKVSNSFTITMSKLDSSFEYIRVYSIHRTSIDAVPTVKRVVDIPIRNDEVIGETNKATVGSHSFSSYNTSFMIVQKNGTNIPLSNYSYTSWTSTETLLTYFEYLIPLDSSDRILFHAGEDSADGNLSFQIAQGGTAVVTFTSDNSGPKGLNIKSLSGTINRYNFTILQGQYGSAQIVDSGTIGEIIDPTELLYKGSETITASTIAQKDNTLFLGNLKLSRGNIPPGLKSQFRNAFFSFSTLNKGLINPKSQGYYPYDNQLDLDSFRIKTFKYLEWYRIGVQFQHVTGKWSEAVFVKDAYNEQQLQTNLTSDFSVGQVVGNLILPGALSNQLQELGYIRARGVVCYPSTSEREVVAQGILQPTVYNVQDRASNSPFAMSSWFTRPNSPFDFQRTSEAIQLPGGIAQSDFQDRRTGEWPSIHSRESMWGVAYHVTGAISSNFDVVKSGTLPEFRHNFPIPGNDTRRGEIQCVVGTAVPQLTAATATDQFDYISTNGEYFFVDQSILSFHSPDVEFDNNVKNIDSTNLKLRIVGMVPITSSASEIDIQSSTPKIDPSMPGFYKENIGSENISIVGAKGLIGGIFWMDKVSNPVGTQNNMFGFAVYPWHRNGSLTNAGVPTGDEKRAAMLEKKIQSTIRYSYNSLYYNTANIWKAFSQGSTVKTGISGVGIFDSNEQSLIKIPAPSNSNMGDISYYGNVDKVVNITRNGEHRVEGYPIHTTGDLSNTDSSVAAKLFRYGYITMDPAKTSVLYGTEPCHIKYKSTAHAVVALNYTSSGDVRILPTIQDEKNGIVHTVNNRNAGPAAYFWDLTPRGINQDIISSPKPYDVSYNIAHGFLWLAELYNDQVVNRFGGQTEEAVENNLWIPAGEPIKLAPNADTIVQYTEGDTFYQRYDCLKTYPYTKEDQNSIVDIVSFMCETRVNIDGRYDRNRGQIDNLAITPQNFNLLNPVYSQSNNFFNYRSLNSNKLDLDKFQSTVTWTKTKTPGEFTDTWTNLTLASVLDLDGDKGALNAIRRYNNDLYAFQDRGISKILFNSRVQVNASDGVPIEISNSYKVDGKIYITQDIGCRNKWSIVTTPSGLYFVDDLNSAIYRYNGQFEPISDILGFKSFMNDFVSVDYWDSVKFKNFVGYNDLTNGDVYFTNKYLTLGYSEQLGQFTSFYSYEKTPLMYNIGKDFFAYRDNKVWHQFKGEYNKFFNVYKPYYVHFIVNPEPTTDKIFDTLEFRADTWRDDKLVSEVTFDHLDAWTEYQKGTTALYNRIGRPSPLKKRFRIWRANIPRDTANRRDRMRNPWLNLRLSMKNPVNYKTELHDMQVYYFS